MNEATRRMREEAMAQLQQDALAGFGPTPLVSVPDPERAPLAIDEADYVVAITYRSRSGSETPHTVGVIRKDGVPYRLTCTCPAALNLEAHPAGCWAMKATRHLIGMYEP